MKPSAIDLDRLLRRLHLPTVRRLYADLETRAEKEEMSHRDYLAILIAEEVAHRGETRVRRSVHQARFPFLATIEEFDFTFQSSVRLSLIGSALGPELISEGRTMVLCGPSGTGKTHLAIAIAYKAIQNGGTAVFREANHLIEELSEATRRGTLRQAMEPYLHTDVLVIDELGYLTYPQDAANVLFQVVNQRYLQKKAIVVTTNKPLEKWAGVLHDKDLAEAIIDRVLARGRLIELRGASYRTRHLKNTKDDGASLDDRSARVSGISGPEFQEPTDLDACRRGIGFGPDSRRSWRKLNRRPRPFVDGIRHQLPARGRKQARWECDALPDWWRRDAELVAARGRSRGTARAHRGLPLSRFNLA